MALIKSKLHQSVHLYVVGEPSDKDLEQQANLALVGLSAPNEKNQVNQTQQEKKLSLKHLIAIEDVKLVRNGSKTRTWLRNKYYPESINHSCMKSRVRDQGCGLDPLFEEFLDFLEHFGPRPEKDSSIDRIDHAGSYSPENVRWASKKTQARNRSNTVFIPYKGVTKPLTEWAEINGVNPEVYRSRRKSGWSNEEIIEGKRSDRYEKTSSPVSLQKCWNYTPWPAKHREFLEGLYQEHKQVNEHRLAFMERYSSKWMNEFSDHIERLVGPDDHTATNLQQMEIERLTLGYNGWNSIHRDSLNKSRNEHLYRQFAMRLPAEVEEMLRDHFMRMS